MAADFVYYADCGGDVGVYEQYWGNGRSASGRH